MDKTNYPILSLVAVVAITAIVAMFLTARADTGITPLAEGAAITANAISDMPLTGMVTSEPPAPVRTGRTTHRFDFNQDGTFNTPDAVVLGRVIDRLQFCPRNTQCDVNNDNFVDIQDLGALNAQILQEAPQETAEPTAAPAAPVQTDDESLAVGTFGAIA